MTDWYFDFISPFAYLQFGRLGQLPGGMPRLRPVLFAGLLGHWGQLGPAEIAAKRRFTYRYALWRARADGIELRAPPQHPFPPLAPLRLAIALEATPQCVADIFDFIWREGRDPDADWPALCERVGVGVDEGDALVAQAQVKAGLRENTEAAIGKAVFGVPTLVINDELFWGVDATQMAIDYLRDPIGFDDAEMARVSDLPAGVHRARR